MCGGVGGSDEELGALPRDAKRRFECRASGGKQSVVRGTTDIFIFVHYLRAPEVVAIIFGFCVTQIANLVTNLAKFD